MTRLHRSHGFGVQSPNDFAFVREVIEEKTPYYPYDDLGKDDDSLTRKLGFLYFRIANWRQPDVIESDAYQDYLHAGCRKSVFGESDELILVSSDRVTLDYLLTDVLGRISDATVLVVDGIHNSKQTLETWRALLADNRVKVTFDLYYCGIVFFDKKRYKKHYKIRF